MSDERIDDIGFSGLRLIQKPEAFCYGVDAVLIASFAKVRKGGSVCDLGTGTGVIPLILSHKTQASRIVGVEVQEESWKRAVRNVALNDLQGRLAMVHSDVLHVKDHLEQGSFDTVVSNPPYMERGGSLKNEDGEKTIARHETTASLKDFMEAAFYLLKDKGSFYMVHRPARLVDICDIGRRLGLEPKQMQFVSAAKGSRPNILLVHMVKGGGRELRFMDPLWVYEEDGSYSQQIEAMYERQASDRQ